jgi:hypothetical protein
VEASFAVQGATLKGGRVFEIAPPDLRLAVSQDEPDIFRPQETALTAKWRFPAGSVTAIELETT